MRKSMQKHLKSQHDSTYGKSQTFPCLQSNPTRFEKVACRSCQYKQITKQWDWAIQKGTLWHARLQADALDGFCTDQQMRNWHHSLLQLWRATSSQLLSLQTRCIRNSLQNRVLGSTWSNWEAKAIMHLWNRRCLLLRTSHRPDTNMHQFHADLWPSYALPSVCKELLKFGNLIWKLKSLYLW